MDENQAVQGLNVAMSVVGLILAIIVFVAVWIVGGILFNLFDNLRGIGSDKLQAIFREIFVPGVGGYAAMAVVSSWLEKADTRFVFLSFSAVLLILMGVYIGLVGPVASKIGIDVWEFLLAVLALVAEVIGAYINIRHEI